MNYQIKISHYFNYFLVVVFMLSFSGSAWGQTDDYPDNLKQNPCANSVSDPWSFVRSNCTSFVAHKLNQDAGTSSSPYAFFNHMTGTGNSRLSHAMYWDERLNGFSQAGYGLWSVCDKPAPGTIAQWNANEGVASDVGHVAYVYSVNANGTCNIQEYNFNPLCGYNYRTNVTAPRYIYPPWITKGVINDNMSIYGGDATATVGRTAKFYFYYTGGVTASNIIAGGQGSRVRIGTAGSPQYATITNVQNAGGNANMKIVTVTMPVGSGLTNGQTYDIAFSLNSQVYTGVQLVYYQKAKDVLTTAGITTTETGTNNSFPWMAFYARMALERGYMRAFNTTNDMTNGEAAVIIVKAALEAGYADILNGNDGQPFRIRTETTNGYYADVPPCHPLFPYIQTLRNYGYSGAVANFGVNDFTTISSICSRIVSVFKIPANPIAYPLVLGSKINISTNDAIARIQKVSVVRQSNNSFNSRIIEKGFANAVDETDIIFGNGLVSVDATSRVRRQVLSKMLVNVYDAKAKGDAGNKSTSDMNKFVIIGDKFELTDNTSGSAPAMSSASQNITMQSGQSRDFGSGISTWGNARIHYYWTFSDGSAISQNSKNSKITFTAPTVTTTMTIDAYGYIATENGMAAELFTKITVTPLPAGCNPASITATASNNSTSTTCAGVNINLTCTLPTGATVTWTGPNGYTSTTQNPTINNIQTAQAGIYYATVKVGTCEKVVSTEVQVGFCTPPPATPTVQASGLNFTNIGNDNVKCNYTLGGGERVIVLMSQSPINQAPVDGQSYSANNHYPSASSLGNAKIVYIGSANAVNVYGLTASNSQPYYVAVYAFNGTGTTTKYLTTNPASGQVTIQVPIPSIDFGWDPETIVSGQSVNFSVSGGNLVSANWIFQGGTPATSTSVWGAYGIIFANAGVYNVTYTATNEWGGTNTITKPVNVLNANDLKPDMYAQGLSLTSPSVVQGQSVSLTFQEVNGGLTPPNQFFHVRVFLSLNDTYDAGDTQLTNDLLDNNFPAGSSRSITKNLTMPFVTAGNYHILVFSDFGDLISEKNETNNVTTIPITIVTALSDLILQNCNVTPSTSSSGSVITITGQVRNIGLGATSTSPNIVTYYISSDNILDFSDYNLMQNTSCFYSNLFPTGIVNFNSSNIRSLPNIPNGNYYLIVTVDNAFDGLNWNVESNENNNIIALPIVISNPNQPTLQALNIQISNLNLNSATLSCNPGNGSQRLVAVGLDRIEFKNFTNGHIPLDGTTYNTNTNFGLAPHFATSNINNSYAVKAMYHGNASMVNLTNLTPNRLHFFSIFESNGTGTNVDYRQIIGEQICTETKTSNVQNGGWTEILSDNPYFATMWRTPNGHLFACDFSGYVFKSVDNGKFWSMSKLPVMGGVTPQIFFTDNNIGYICNYNDIYKTTNAGVSWSKIFTITAPAGGSFQFGKIQFLNPNVGYYILQREDATTTLYKTTNGGVTWTSLYVAPSRVYDFQFLDEQNGYLAGVRVYRTTNSGTSWEIDESFNNLFFNTTAINFINQSLGYCTKTNGKVYKTIDSGKIWVEVGNPSGLTSPQAASSQLWFANELVGYIAGNQRLAKTTDGGITWTNAPDISGKSFYQIFGIDANTVWVAGSQKLLFTSTGGDPRAINAPTLPTTVYCEGSTINIPYTIAGTFTAGNTFSVQLSNTEGKFTNPLVLGSLSSIANGTISCPLPAGIVGTGYKLRIVGSSPATIGAETNYTLTLNPRPQASFVGLLPSYCNSSSSVSLLPLVSGGIFSGTGVSGASFNPATAGVGVHTITYSLTQNGCTFSTSQSVEVTTATVSITSANAIGCKGESVLLQVSNPRPNAVYQWRRNGVEITGATGGMFFASELGNALYSAVSNEGGCVATSNNLPLNIIEVPKPTITPNNNLLASSSTTGNQWYFNGVAIPNATTQFFTMNHTIAGFYSVEVTQNGCKSISDFFTVPNPPNIPNNLQLTLIPVLKGVLTWEASTNATGYQLERSSTSATSGFSILTEVASNILTYTDDVLPLPRVTYWYRVRAKGVTIFSNYSNIVELNAVTAIEEPLWVKNIKIYPNPVRDFIKVNLDGLQLSDISYSLFDTQGRQVLKNNVILDNNSMFTIGVTQLSKGVYNLQINANKGKINRLIVVE